MKKTVAFCTLGCKVNQYESEAVSEQFLKRGYELVDFSQAADVYVINTCTVTHLSDRKSRQMIRRAKQINPSSVLAVMGCYAQTNPEAVRSIPEVDIIIGTAGRCGLPDLVEDFLAQRERMDLVQGEVPCEFESMQIDGSGAVHTRAHVKVQDGCNQFCSYCIIPYARGRIRSRSIADTVAEAERLAAAGFLELVVTGIHIASWGKDSGEGDLADLLEALEGVPGIERIRLGSLEPTLCTEKFVERLKSLKKLCRHFHLSLQSGCDATLRRMNRKYTADMYQNAVFTLRQAMPDVAVTTDIIVGFPQESEEDFLECYQFVEKLSLADAHIFKYSPRAGTVAANMSGQVSPKDKESRSRRLLSLAQASKEAFAERFIGRQMSVLFEQEIAPNVYEGKTENYITVQVTSTQPIVGSLKTVVLTSLSGDVLLGEIMS
ncbi:MAG: tRNA (N(6)-L-threonylcarbamoyladenosine(37)-C(2))-methylthiotransferase MtaB [Clostridia bacterium]|nr:tRNA (N(6)-L-threonylcarbamoyladenosine(37)-C(2))-methylthiotransferase MtaB [Clostridia bacterium]